MATKRAALTDFVVEKEAPALPLPDTAGKGVTVVDLVGNRRKRKPEKGSAADGRIGQTLRLHPEAWEALKGLAARERVSAHDLVVEGVNKVFRSRKLPEIA